MTALRSFSTALSTIARKPSLAVVALVIAFISTLSVVGRGGSSVVSSLVSLVGSALQLFVIPFFVAGFYALANAARTRTRDGPSFFEAGRRYYLSLLGAGLLLGIVFGVAVVVLTIIALVAGGGFALLNAMRQGTAPSSTVIAEIAVVAVILFVVHLFFQFYDVAIVVDDENAISGIGRSIDFVASHFVSALGFALLSGAISLVISVLASWPFLFGGATTVQGAVTAYQSGVGIVGFVGLLVGTLVSDLVVRTYKLCFYAETTEAGRSDESPYMVEPE